jgi:hybrid cluster-associated redox disulfide protein
MARIRIDDPDLPLADLMTEWPQTITVFLRHGMLCVGCLVSPIHTVSDACAAYHLDEELFLWELMRAAGLA